MTDLDKLEAARPEATAIDVLRDIIAYGPTKWPLDVQLDALHEIEAHLAAQRQAPEDRAAAFGALDKAGSWMAAALNCDQTCRECKDDFSTALDAIETIRLALANSVPGDVLERVAAALREAEKRFSAIDAESNDAAEVACREALRDLAPWVKGVG